MRFDSLIIFIIFSVLIFGILVNGSLNSYDQARYYLNAKSIIEGNGYRWAWHPENPQDRYILPGYSAFLALLMLISDKVLFLKYAQLPLHIGSSVLIYALIAKKNAKIFPALFILNPLVLFYSTLLAPEALLIVLFLLVFYLFDKGAHPFLIGAFCGLCTFVKLEAALLPLSLFAYMLIRKNRGAALWLTGGFGAVMLFSIPFLKSILYTQASYHAAVSLSSLTHYFRMPLVSMAAIFAAAALLYCHKKQKLDAKYLPYLMFSVIYFATIVAYPSKDLRYLLLPGIALIPVFSSIYQKLGVDRLVTARVVLVVAIFAMVIGGTYAMNGYSEHTLTQWAEYDAALAKLSNYESGVVLSRRAEEAYLQSGMQAVNYPYTDDRAVLAETIARYGGRYFVKDQFEWTGTTEQYYYWLEEGAAANGYCFTELFRVDKTAVFEIATC